MIVIIDERELVTTTYGQRFTGEGFAATGFKTSDFRDWVQTAPDPDVSAVEAFFVGDCSDRISIPPLIRERSHAPVIAMSECSSLDQTLQLFAAGADDVVRKPIHVRELIARLGAIRRRTSAQTRHTDIGQIRIFFDGRDPEVAGCVLPLPRRERRVLEYLATHYGRRVTKSQIFGAIYGIFDEEAEENVVESHISKLRKKLRYHLGYDPIDSKRYLGYCLMDSFASASIARPTLSSLTEKTS